MNTLRSNVAKKAANFMRVSQQPPPPPPPAAGAPPPAAPARPIPAPGVPPVGAPPLGTPPPAAPGMAPRDVAEQNITKQVEQQKMQEVKLEKVEQAITQNNEKIEDLVDAVVHMKQVIEQTLLGEPGMDDKLKKLKEKQQKNKTTPEEFGLDKDNLIVSKEEGKMTTGASELRRARKERLAGDLKYHSDKYDPEGLKYHDADPEDKKYKQEVPAPQITKVKKSEVPDIFKIAMDLSDDESKWSVVDKTTEEVLYEINKTDLNKTGFSTKEYAHAVINDMKTLGLSEAMAKHGAIPLLPMMDKVPEKKEELGEKKDDLKKDLKEILKDKKEDKLPDKLHEKKEDKIPDLKIIKKDLPFKEEMKKEESAEPVDQKLAAKISEKDIQRRFMRAFRLALSAQQKNLIDNPLKAAWFKALTAMNIEKPQILIESTFSGSALDQFEVALGKAEEYLNLSDEAFVEAETTIGDFATKVPTDEDIVESPRHQSARDMQMRAKKASMVVSTASDSDGMDRASAIAQALPMPKLAGISRFSRQR